MFTLYNRQVKWIENNVYIHVESGVLCVKCLEFKVHIYVGHFDCCEKKKNQVGIVVLSGKLGVSRAVAYRGGV